MFLPTPLLVLLTLPTLTFSTPSAQPYHQNKNQNQQPLLTPPSVSTHLPRTNAPSILNTLHASLRQFPSSLHHNGLSFFLASIPAGSLLYHGTRRIEAVTGMEWLAVEVEHAEIFARPRGPRRGGPGGGGGGGRPPPGDGEGPPPPSRKSSREKGWSGEKESERSGERGEIEGEEEEKGYLHIYQTNHALKRLLYVDGMSAAKCSLGTLDSTDLILLSGSLSSSTSFPSTHSTSRMSEGEEEKRESNDDKTTRDRNSTAPPWHPGSDYERARGLCELAVGWEVEGFVRMEAGFELILCDFEKHVSLLSVRQRPISTHSPAPAPPRARNLQASRVSYAGLSTEEGDTSDEKEGEELDVEGFEYIRALEQRYHGLPAGTVEVDYSSMVSAYFHPKLDLSNPSPLRTLAKQPRLIENSQEELQVVRDELMQMLEARTGDEEGIEWQSVADLIITRYSPRLPYLAHQNTSVAAMLADLGVLLDLYIDYGNLNITSSREECGRHYLNGVESAVEKGTSDGLIYAAILEVTSSICGVLFDVREELLAVSPFSSSIGSAGSRAGEERDTSMEKDVKKLKRGLAELMEWLDWSTWNECGKCMVDEVCFVAIWPWGGVEDHENPGCVGMEEVRGRRGYWYLS